MPPTARSAIALATVALAASHWLGCQTAVADPEPLPPRPIHWAEARTVATDAQLTISGTVQPAHVVRLSAEIAGQVVTVNADVGDTVSEGDVLIELDRTALRQAVSARRAEVAEAVARRDDAEQVLARQQALYDRGATTDLVVDSAAASVEAARSRVRALRANLEMAETTLRDATVTAPFNAWVARRLVEPAEVVAPGIPMLELHSIEAGIELEFFAPESAIAGLAEGTVGQVRAMHDAGGVTEARVIEVGAYERSGGGYRLRALPTDPSGLREGMSVELSFDRGARAPGAVAVPVDAVVAGDGDTQYVFVFDRDASNVGVRPVELARIEGDEAWIASGLSANEVVATRGASFLRDGQPVTLLNDETNVYVTSDEARR